MENLIFSLNATMPIFFMMVLGCLFCRMGVFDEMFADKMNKFVFQVALPVLLFKDLSASNFYSVWDTKFVLFCFLATLASIAIALCVSFFLKDKSNRGEFIQSSFRSSSALIGVAFAQNIYGDAGAVPLMIIGAVPLYNITAVLILTLMKPDRGKMDKKLALRTVQGVLKNPMILGILAGLCWSLLRIPQPVVMQKTIGSFSAITTPMGLMALGASFDSKKAMAQIKPVMACATLKLVIYVAAFMPIAVWMGFREDKLIAILVMLGAATTVSCFTMARNMGHEGTLSASTVMITTLLSAFTLTGWLYLLKDFNLV